MDWIEYLTLGVIQGITEFLPISSDGHLTIAQQAFAASRGSSRTGAENLFIDIMLHIGTLCAILLHYRGVIAAGLRGLISGKQPNIDPATPVDAPVGAQPTGASGSNPYEAPRARIGPSDEGSPYRPAAILRVLALAVVATMPAVPVGLFLKKQLEKTLESPVYSGLGFLVTAAVLLLTTMQKGGDKGPSRTTFLDALLIGIAQAFAPLPGVSRSGLTIATALGLGFSRTWAVQFSLMMAVPVIGGAAVLELRKVDPHVLAGGHAAQIVAASIVAGVVGYGAIVWLVRVVRSGKMWYFSVYLVVLAAVVLAWSFLRGGTPVADRPTALDGPARGGLARPLALRDRSPAAGPLDRPVGPGPRAGRPGTRADHPGRPGAGGLDVGRPLAGEGRPSSRPGVARAGRGPGGVA